MKLLIISGPSGSGKTTLSKELSKKHKNTIVLNTDNYYKTGLITKVLSKIIVNYYDRKISFNYKRFKKDLDYIINNRELNHKYTYDFKSKTIIKSFYKQSNLEFLIVEGIFTKDLLSKFNKNNCFHIELKTNKESCMKRVIHRDINERGKNKNIAKKEFLKAWEIYYKENQYRKPINKKNELLYSKATDIDNLLKKIINAKT